MLYSSSPTTFVNSYICFILYCSIEEANGIDSLLDWVDDLDLDQELATALVDDDDDEWSQPASSILGDNFDDSVLFEM
jgi:hypothetical protein